TIEIDIVKNSPQEEVSDSHPRVLNVEIDFENSADNNQPPLPEPEENQPPNTDEEPPVETIDEPYPVVEQPEEKPEEEQPQSEETGEPLEAVLKSKSNELNKVLLEMYPELQSKFDKYKKGVNACYDTHVTANLSVNIFQDKVNSIIEKFFKETDNSFKNASQAEIEERVQVVVENFHELAELLLKCAQQHAKGKPTMKLGLSEISFYSHQETKTRLFSHPQSASPEPPQLAPGEERIFQTLGRHEPDFSKERNLSALAPKFRTFCNIKPIAGDKPIPREFNWVQQTFVSPVVNQGFQCDAGYVMAATAALESQYMMRTGEKRKPTILSAQATLHCMAGGCKGGSLASPIRFMVKHGAPLAGLAPYTGSASQSQCYTGYPYAVQAEDTCFFSWLKEAEMQRLVLRNGPASVPLDASARDFRYLKNSPYLGPCSSKRTNHAALLVGWTAQYWLIKNSFGENWGTKGYLYLPRGQSQYTNKCGIQTDFAQPIIRSIKTKKQWLKSV
ncbi:PREDICTED: cathepsin L-like, partial [Rhagoletis zephyria]|uniref:cathepsin L-like n=1 Tax=Rhagoletis zephyria TaxID=28612 RepID=UPI0008118ABF